MDADFRMIAEELVRRREHDFSVRERLLEAGRLNDGYDPEMEAVHLGNAAWLEAVVEKYGYPTIGRVGADASNAAWLIIQHAISRPAFLRRMLAVLRSLPEHEADPKNAAYLEDRIRMYEGKPQRYGTQFDRDDDGLLSPVPCDDPALVDRCRAALGLPPLAEVTAEMRKRDTGRPTREELERHRARCRAWLIETGWRTPPQENSR